jgi:hypothetical protein
MPYAPGIEYRGDQTLMQGFMQRNQNAQQGMMAAVDYFTKQGERRKEEKALAKSMDAFYKTESGGKVLKEMNIPAHDYFGMSDSDRIAIGKAGHESVAMKGIQQKFEQVASEFLAKQKMDAAQLTQLEQANTQRGIDAAGLARYQAGVRNMTTPLQVPEGMFGVSPTGAGGRMGLSVPENIGGGTLSGEDMGAMAQRSGVSPKDQEDMARAFHLWQEGQGGRGAHALAFEEDPVSGQRFATFGNMMQPSGTNPTKSASKNKTIVKTTPLLDPWTKQPVLKDGKPVMVESTTRHFVGDQEVDVNEVQGQGNAPGAGAQESAFNPAEEVRAAFQAGKLTREQAKKIISDKKFKIP